MAMLGQVPQPQPLPAVQPSHGTQLPRPPPPQQQLPPPPPPPQQQQQAGANAGSNILAMLGQQVCVCVCVCVCV